MRLLLDENLSAQHAVWLRGLGYDAVAVVEVGLAGAPDTRVREFAIEADRVLVTMDGDFADMLRFPPSGTPGVIRLRLHPPREDAIRVRLGKVLEALRETDMAGRLAVSHGDVIRIRS